MSHRDFLPSDPRAPRRAFTLVELLVVIAIIGILVALLLPAVQAAREAARNTQCRSNLKNMALALQNYASTFGTLPPGGITDGYCCGTPSGASWPILILPFVEETALYDRYDFNEFNEHPNNQFVRESQVELYKCPVDEETDELGRPASGPGANLLYARGSYRGNAGLCTVQSGAFWDSSGEQNEAYRNERGPLPGVGNIPGGAWSVTEGTRLSQITDGVSKTILLGEKAHTGRHPQAPRRRTFWAYTYTSYNRSLTFLQTRSIINDYDRCLRIGGAFGDNPCKRSWGSLHPTGLNITMTDGSVHFIPASIDVFIFAAFSTIAGEEVVSLD